MTGGRGRRASIAAAAALAAIVAAAGTPAVWAQAGADALGAPPSGEYRSAVTVGSGALLPTDGYEYRFSATGEWRRLDRPLSLDAFPGERRVYRLFVRQSGRSETILDYVIDRRPPDAPALSPPAGDAGPSLVVGVAAAPGSVIMLSLDGAPFSVFDPAAPPAVQAKADSTRVVWAAAYAIDPAIAAKRAASTRDSAHGVEIQSARTPAGIQLSWLGAAGHGYAVWSCASLGSDGQWTLVPGAENLVGTGEIISMEIPATDAPGRFFRVAELP